MIFIYINGLRIFYERKRIDMCQMVITKHGITGV